MTSRFDFHTHTLHSDGTLSPTELVQRAHACGVEVLAVTDHDVTDGLPEAAGVAHSLGMQLVPGVEISVTWNGLTVHIVGLGIDPDNAALQQGLAGLRQFRGWRAREIAARLAKKKNITDAYEHAARFARGAILSRTHFARFLVEHGYVRTMGEAFKHFLTRGKPGYVPGEWAALSDALRWIHDAGGVAVIAHPARYKLSGGKLRRLIGEFKECGGQAIEVISGSHSADDNRRMGRLACEHALQASAGSDYHGPEKPWVELGRLPALPPECAPVWTALVGKPASIAAQ